MCASQILAALVQLFDDELSFVDDQVPCSGKVLHWSCHLEVIDVDAQEYAEFFVQVA